MTGIALCAVQRPRRVLAVWVAVVGVLSVLGIGLANRLPRTSALLPGTESARTSDAVTQQFGGERWSVLVLLHGPPGALDAEGPRIVAALDRHRDVNVVAPWSPGAPRALRPKPDDALLIAQIQRPFDAASRDVAPILKATIARDVRRPLRAHVAGYPVVGGALHDETISAVERAERIAAPLLVLVLLLVFRSPVAAAVPLFAGLAVLGASNGVLDLINRVTPLDVTALSLAAMMSLALGVDYSLLLVSRFREELATGASRDAAAQTAVATAGRTVRFAGYVLFAAMAASFLISPRGIMSSAAVGTAVAVALSVITAATALPAALSLLGPQVNRWQWGRAGGAGGWSNLALRALRRPGMALVLGLLLVLVLSAPALGLKPHVPDTAALPASSPVRKDFDAIGHEVGIGWATPYELLITAARGPVTDPRRLVAIDRFQRGLAAQPRVQAVLGPGEIARRTGLLRTFGARLQRGRAALSRGRGDLDRAENGLGRARSGASRLSRGLAAAASGAGPLFGGFSRAHGGATQIGDGTARAVRATDALAGALRQGAAGAHALASGLRRGAAGARRLRSGAGRISAATNSARLRLDELVGGLAKLTKGLHTLREPASVAESELSQALDALKRMSVTSQLDPQYRRAYAAVATAYAAVVGRDPRNGERVAAGYDGLVSALTGSGSGLGRATAGVRKLRARLGVLVDSLDRLEHGSARLERGLGRASGGAGRLSRGSGRLLAGEEALAPGLGQLHGGVLALGDGLGRLDQGGGLLRSKLRAGADQAPALTEGLGRLVRGVRETRARNDRLRAGLGGGQKVVSVFDSGYAALAALDKSPRKVRSAVSSTINLDRGGTAARMVVIARHATSNADNPLRAQLRREGARLARDAGLNVDIGGTAPMLQDFEQQVGMRLWLLAVALIAVSYVALVLVLRSLLLPALALALNLVTVAAAFGVLVLAFQGSAPLGGPGFIDDIMLTAIFSIVFALSIDYEVFLLTRIREGYALTGTTDGAVVYGIRHTAGIVTGAAMIMTGVFVAFALSNLSNLRQLGLGLTVAVLLDATLVRLVLLPAAIRLVGDAAWWTPSWLETILPRDPDAAPSDGIDELEAPRLVPARASYGGTR